MKKFSKILILLLFLVILSVSCVNASQLDNNVQDNDDVDLGINEDIIIDYNDDTSLNKNLESNLDDNLDSNLESNLDDSLDNNLESNLDDSLGSNLESNLDDDLDNNLESNSDSNSEYELENNPKNTLKSDETTTYQVSSGTYSQYFDRNGYVITTAVSPGDTLDLSGRFNKLNFIFTIPVSITSSQNNAYLTNCMIKFENVTTGHSSVSNLNFNTSIEMAPCVYILGSNYVEVFNCNAYSTGANSNPTFLVGSNYCHIHNNVFETTFTGYMNMSWKRAGILLGESHYNNISSNFVSVKDSNPIYLTTYGFEKSNYNIIFNNTVTTSAFSDETGLRNPSAWAYGVHVMGDYNQILNNTIMNTYRGVDSEGSFNEIIGNKIFNLSGSYYEGNNGTDGGEGGIFASYNNIIINNTIYDSKITGPAIYAVVNTTVIGNTVTNITGPQGIQFALAASNCLIHNNTIDMNTGNAIYVKGNMANLTLSNNIISTMNGTAILIQKQTRAKYPIDVTIVNNCFLEYSNDYLNYTDVEGKTIINLANNTVVVVNDTFFRFFNADGSFDSNELFENFIFKGEFSDLGPDDGKVSCIDLNGKITIIGDNSYIKDISFNVNSNNVRIDNVFINITNANANTFNFNNVQNASLSNSIIHFNSTFKKFLPILANNSKIQLEKNTIVVYSDNSLLVLNNTNCTLSDNILNSSSLNKVVILNDNNSYLLFGENEINALVDPAIISINGAIIQYIYFIIEDSNYYDYFNPDGSFLDDVIFNFGDTIRIGNVNNKVFRFDIPLVIVGEKGSIQNNSYIILEGESSNSIVSNFTFNVDDYAYSGEISIITIKDGVSDLTIRNNRFNINNLSGDSTIFNGIKVVLSDNPSTNIKIEKNIIGIDSNLSQINGISVKNLPLGLSNQIVDSIEIVDNSISIINCKTDGTSTGINLLDCLNSLVYNNSIYIKSYSTNGIFLEKSNLTIRNNTIEVEGLNYEKIWDYLADNELKGMIEDNLIKADCAVSADRNTYLNDDLGEVNTLIENNGETTLIHYSNSLKDLENIVNNAQNGSVIDLGNNIYIVRDSIDIDKSISVINGIIISDLKEDNVLFNVLASDIDSINNSINIEKSEVILDNANVFLLLNSFDDEDPGLISVPSLKIGDNKFISISDQVVSESITLVKLSSNKRVLNPSNSISVENNVIQAGMDVFKFSSKSITNGSDILIPNTNPLSDKIPSLIVCEDMVTTAVDTATDGRVGEYFNISLKDSNGNPLTNKAIQIGFNGKVYNRTTDDHGKCKLQINLEREGIFTFAVSFLGDDMYNGSFAVAKITVKKQTPVITCSNYYFKASEKQKKISVSLKSASRKPLANKVIKLTVNGKTYSAKTNSNGVATINVSLSTKKTYSFTVKYDGDNTYSAVSKTAKITIS